ncbi:ribosome-associated GTPase EngA [SAR116 cluster alpha proteobacterium HIMB100]|nr:ribosome-associated GTPase EngA [SAR116 cluster alpha proteobacterium HIMB100]
MTVTLAIVGRPNVGKSTLFNRLTGTRHAIVDDQPGVTRDRREGDGRLAEMRFRLIDTAGLEKAKSGSLEDRMRQQTELAVQQADITLLVIDARAGLLPDDLYFARQIRRSGTPVVVLANKCEGKSGVETLAEAWQLGLGAAVPVSAAHGDGLSDLYDAILEQARQQGLEPALFGEDEAESEQDETDVLAADSEDEPDIWIDEAAYDPIRIAVVGRPNMGKSTLVNALLGEQRLLTGPEAGITRDAITLPFAWQGQNYQLVDTAGIRRQARVTEKVERLMVNDAQRAIQYARVCVLMLDARQPPHRQDMVIARQITDEGRALVIAANMWDDVADKQAAMQLINDRLETSLAQVRGVPVVPISGLYGRGLDRLMKTIEDTHKLWNTRISTGRLNRWLEPMLEAHPPPMSQGRRLRIRYMTQVRTRPPTFALFASRPVDLPESYLRYLIGGLRADFGLGGIPIRMLLRKGSENPYAPKR